VPAGIGRTAEAAQEGSELALIVSGGLIIIAQPCDPFDASEPAAQARARMRPSGSSSRLNGDGTGLARAAGSEANAARLREDADMFWRKWFVRSVVFGIVGSCAAGAYLYEHWTNPAAVREQVLRRLGEIFPGASVSLDSAHLRLLGGIQVQELRLVRKGDRDNVDIAYIPSAVLYHDKERLLDGELVLRKIELFRPRLRAYRGADGTWSVQNILAKPKLEQSQATVVIHQGTLVLEDRATAGNVSSLEITDLNLILINDPLPTLQFEGVAQSPTVGKLTLLGTAQRATREIELTLSTRDTPLSTKLAQRLAPLVANAPLDGLDVSGAVDIDTKIRWQPDAPLRYEVTARFRDCAVRHPSLPTSLDKLCTTIRIADGNVWIEKATARSGSMTFAASAKASLASLASLATSFEATITAKNVPFEDEMIRKLPAKLTDLKRMFQPEGLADISMKLARKEGRWTTTSDGGESVVTVQPVGASATLVYFPYKVTGITGSVNHYLVTGRTHFELDGLAAGQPVSVVGKIVGAGKDLDLAITGRVAGLPIDETLVSCLPAEPQKFARSFRPTGTVDAVVRVRREPGSEAFRNEFLLNFRDTTMRWEAFPLPLTDVSGQLDIRPEKWEFRNFRAKHGAGAFAIHGSTFAVAGKAKLGVEMQIEGRQIPLDASLRAALEPIPAIARAWDQFRPSGAMDFRADIRRPSDDLDKLDVTVTASGASVEPTFFRYALTEIGGVVHFRNRQLQLAALSGKHGATRWVLGEGGVIELLPGGGYRADLQNIDVEDLLLDADFIRALPASLQKPCEAIGCKTPVRARARLIVAQGSDPGEKPDFYWDTQAWVKDTSIFIGVPADGVTGVVGCRGRHDGTKLVNVEGNILLPSAVLFKQTLTDVSAHFHVAEQSPTLLLAEIHAPVYGGSIAGEVRVDFGAPAVRYELNLTAAQINLQKLGRKNIGEATKLEGNAVGRLHLTGTSAGVKSLDGDGSFDVISAKLYNLPLLLDLLKFLGLRWPDRTAFEELHALFRVQGPRVAVKRLELQGNAISLTGQGEFNLDGTDLSLDFSPTWARIDQLLPPALRTVPPAVSKNFLVIEIRGKVGSNPGDLKFTKKPMPVILDPLNSIRHRILGEPTGSGASSVPGETPMIPPVPLLGPAGR
jgi:AsmA-like protein